MVRLGGCFLAMIAQCRDADATVRSRRIARPASATASAIPPHAGSFGILVADEPPPGPPESAVTTRIKVALVVPAALVAPSVIVHDPTAVGVPEITPVTGSKLSPGGRPLALVAVGLSEKAAV